MPIKRHHSNDGDTVEKSQKAVKKPKPSEKTPNGKTTKTQVPSEKPDTSPDVEEKKSTAVTLPTLPVLEFKEEKFYNDSEFKSPTWLTSWESTIKNIRSKKNFLAENNLTQPEVDKVQREILLMVCGLKKVTDHYGSS